MTQSREDALRIAALRRREGHFTYGGGGFPLHLASYHLLVDSEPTIPHDAQVKTRLQAAGLAVTPEGIDAYRAVALAHLQKALDAYQSCHFKVLITVGTDQHELRYVEAVRFLRAMGVLRICVGCNKECFIPDLDSDACSDCGYRSLDMPGPTVGQLIGNVVGQS